MYNKNQIGRVITNSSGIQEQTSTFYDILKGGSGFLAATGNPFAAVISAGFGVLDSIFCGKKCHQRREIRAAQSKISGVCNCSQCNSMGNLNSYNKPKIF